MDGAQISRNVMPRRTGRPSALCRLTITTSASTVAKRYFFPPPLSFIASYTHFLSCATLQIARTAQIQSHWEQKQSRQLESQKREREATVSGIMALGLARREREDKERQEGGGKEDKEGEGKEGEDGKDKEDGDEGKEDGEGKDGE